MNNGLIQDQLVVIGLEAGFLGPGLTELVVGNLVETMVPEVSGRKFAFNKADEWFSGR